LAFGTDYDLDSGFRQNDGVGVDAKARNSKLHVESTLSAQP
jgi:hypothetical protein